jgi:lysophospholipase L1-like esterase
VTIDTALWRALRKIKRTTKQIASNYLINRQTTSTVNIICFGDSITEGAEFHPADCWPRILQRKLDAWRPKCYQVYNRGKRGDTSSQGFDRFSRHILPHLPGLLLVQFGFNDANVPVWTPLPRVSLDRVSEKSARIPSCGVSHQQPMYLYRESPNWQL